MACTESESKHLYLNLYKNRMAKIFVPYCTSNRKEAIEENLFQPFDLAVSLTPFVNSEIYSVHLLLVTMTI